MDVSKLMGANAGGEPVLISLQKDDLVYLDNENRFEKREDIEMSNYKWFSIYANALAFFRF